MPLFSDHANNTFRVFLAELRGLGLDHHADDRLGSALADHDPPGVPEGCGDLRDGALHVGVVPGRGLALYPDALHDLRVEHHWGGKLAHRLSFGKHDLHQLQAGEDPVAGGLVFEKDGAPALLAAEAASTIPAFS